LRQSSEKHQGLGWHFIDSEFVAKIHFSYEINVGPRVLSSIFFFFIFSCCSKSGDQPEKDLAKSGYNTNKEIENLGIIFRVGTPC
jgi:hypothetical protein